MPKVWKSGSAKDLASEVYSELRWGEESEQALEAEMAEPLAPASEATTGLALGDTSEKMTDKTKDSAMALTTAARSDSGWASDSEPSKAAAMEEGSAPK